ncbi:MULTISPECIES: DUF2189 domain-containing protein [unclassified Ruegeria]|uniref:DUF2189 domain-containing protein n=1 Tax=unclassified Ruegeria TaxID=2625375 RepID=UPI001ADCFD84|nr:MULTISPECIES: DUF2189 domain-containing protein [unclassified Ruegeria]MBO9411625.1 DUF2189 domain-containing protein [Ruegeria sp. R8_1]MBO9415813.1 DUF2189 domain-containing protein [Ruegeria sp. R8_2]
MVRTIGNPISWAAQTLGATSDHVAESVTGIGGAGTPKMPKVQTLSFSDLWACLRAGSEDFMETRADAVFVVLIYPLAGLLMFGFGLNRNMIPLLAPLIAGFALIGPVAAVGLYEISRKREQGAEAHWLDALGVFRSPSFGAILTLGFYLVALLLIWLMVAQSIYVQTLGPDLPTSFSTFVLQVFTTKAGWVMILSGILVGFFFALVALATSVISFPLLLDRKVGVPLAVVTSVRVLRHNPSVILTWGLVVSSALILGAIPMLLGLIVVIPVLGHATWHLYRCAVT